MSGLFGQTGTQGGFSFGQNQQSGGTSLFGNSQPQQNQGQPQQGQTGNMFGQPQQSSGLFGGAQSQPQQGSLFGAGNNAQTSTFGQQNGTGFGQTQSTFGQNNNTSTFGATNNQQSGGLFGANKPATGGLFGGQSQPQQTQSTGLFGNSQPQGGLFGSNQNQQQPGATGANTQNQTGGLFGANKPASTGSLFGASNTNTSAPTTGLFGSNNNTAPAAPAGSLFGGNNQQTTGTTNTGTGLFGNNQSTTTTGTSGGLFGNSQPSGGLFGSSTNTAASGTTQPAQTSGGLFGNNTTQPAQTGGGLFGNTTSAPAATGTSLFGNNAATTTQQPSTGLFGSNNTQSGTAGGLFGSKPATTTTTTGTGGLFGNTNATTPAAGTGGLFGNSTNNATQTGGLFGNKPATTTTGGGLFGSSTASAAPATGTGLFGSSTNAPGSGLSFGQPASNGVSATSGLPPLTATKPSLEQFTLTLNPSAKLYSSLTPAPKEGRSKDRAAAPALPNPTLSLRNGISNKVPRPSNTTSNEGTELKRSEARQEITRQWMSSYDTFIANRPTTLVIKRSQPKRLALAVSSVNEADGKVKTVPLAITAGPSSDGTVTQSETAADTTEVDPDVSLFHKTHNKVTLVRVNRKALEQHYFIRPSLEVLASYSEKQLSAVEGLVIGREGFGQIEYSSPVDLTGIENLGDILGNIVVFDHGTVAVYPDENTKAREGTQLNLPATVTIENAFPLDADRERIVDMEDPRMAKHIARLRRVNEKRGGEFITFTHGIWIFKVPHFSVWGLPADEMVISEDEDEDDDDDIEDDEDLDNAPTQDSITEEPMGALDVAQDKPGLPLEASFDEDVGMDTFAHKLPTKRNPFNIGASLSDRATPTENILPVDVISTISSGLHSIPENQAPVSGTELNQFESEQDDSPSTWLEQLDQSTNSELVVSRHALIVKSRTHDKFTSADLHEILFGPRSKLEIAGTAEENLRIPPKSFFRSNSLLIPAGDVDAGVKTVVLPKTKFDASKLHELATIELNRSNTLSKLSTSISFSELKEVYPHPLWDLLSLLFDEQVTSNRDRLSRWLEEKVDPIVKSESGRSFNDFDALWTLISGHKLQEAAVRAVSSSNPHLATIIALLDHHDASANASKLLESWTESNAIVHIPSGVRRIIEVASGNLGVAPARNFAGHTAEALDLLAGLDWKRSLGMHLWYGPKDRPLHEIIDDVARTSDVADDVEFAFLRLVNRPENLAAALSFLDGPRAFCVLQALQTQTNLVANFNDSADKLYNSLAFALLESEQVISAIFVALHINDDELTLATVRAILSRAPQHLTNRIFGDLGVPSSLLLEARALYARYIGDYLSEARFLLGAGQAEAAHEVIITKVAPQTIIENNTQKASELLEQIPSNTPGWASGGKIYLDFLSFLQAPTAQLALSLSNTLPRMKLSSLEIRVAVSIMADYVVSHSRGFLSTSQVMGMPMSSSQYRIQALTRQASAMAT